MTSYSDCSYDERKGIDYAALLMAAIPFLRIIKFVPELSTSVYYALIFIVGIAQYGRYGITSISKITVAFFVFCILSLLVNTVDPGFRASERLVGLLLIIVAVGPLFYNDYSVGFRENCLRYIMYGAIGVCLISILLYFTARSVTITERGLLYGGITVHSMTMGPLSALGCFYSFTHLIERMADMGWKYRALWGTYTVICLLNSVLAGSRAALVALFVSMIVWLWIFLKENKKLFIKYAVSIVAVIILTIPLWWSYTETIQKKIEYSEMQGSVMSSRQGRWEARIDEIKADPIFGCGFSTIRGTASEKGTVEPGNGWLFIWSSAGLIPLILFVTIYLKSALAALQCWTIEGLFVFAVLIFFGIHLFAEGYSISSGNPFCLLLWLTIGLGSFYRLELE